MHRIAIPSISIPPDHEPRTLPSSSSTIPLFPPDLGPQFDDNSAMENSLPSSTQRKDKLHRIRKGDGPESRRNAPDPYDEYPFGTVSIAYAHLVRLGLKNISMVSLVRLSNAIERYLVVFRPLLTRRNRNAKRRKSNAFHWLDENWGLIGPIFEMKVREGGF
jgi:hypothetical protein